jgi:hypothetical protein
MSLFLGMSWVQGPVHVLIYRYVLGAGAGACPCVRYVLGAWAGACPYFMYVLGAGAGACPYF